MSGKDEPLQNGDKTLCDTVVTILAPGQSVFVMNPDMTVRFSLMMEEPCVMVVRKTQDETPPGRVN